jgi:hypothetical protein
MQKIPPFVLSACLALGCAPKAPPPAIALPHAPERHIYRLDFVLTSSDGAAAATTTAFTLNLLEAENGQVMVGKNIPLVATSSGPASSARQDVGLRIKTKCRTLGDDVLLEVDTEMSASDPPAIRKVLMYGGGLASLGKSTVLSILDDDHKRYQLSVTPTRLR